VFGKIIGKVRPDKLWGAIFDEPLLLAVRAFSLNFLKIAGLAAAPTQPQA